jgi:hypothetical protein
MVVEVVHAGKGGVKCVEIAGIPLKGRAIFRFNFAMSSYAFRRLINHLPIRIGTRSDRWLRTANLKHSHFASFLETDGFGLHHVDHYERSLRRRRFAKWLFVASLAAAGAWIAIESARAVVLL